MYVPVGLGNTNWTPEWRAYIPRLFQLTMVQIASPTQSISFGLSGGGAFKVIGPGINATGLGNPPTNNWRYFGAQNNGGAITYWMSSQYPAYGNFLIASAPSSLTSPMGERSTYHGG